MGEPVCTENAGHKGKLPPDKGKLPPDKGRSGGNGQAILGAVTDGAACVVLRASVETFGPAGDAELNFHVKWHGTTLAAPDIVVAGTADSSSSTGGLDPEGNIFFPATNPIPTESR